MKRGIRSGVLGAVLLALAAACGQATSSGAGSNTNWLLRCVSDSQCGGSLSCWCGVCTAPCTNDSICSPLDPKARCASGNNCSSAPAPDSACTLACKSNADCAQGNFCSDGMCKSLSVTSDDRCAAERSARAAFIAQNRACKSDQDCRLASSSCAEGSFDCTHAFYLNVNADMAEFERLSDTLLACASDPARGPDTCNVETCHRVSAAATCGVDGQCTALTETPSCDARILGLTRNIGAVIRDADKSCQVDADCQSVGLSSSCYETCNTSAVATSSAATVQSAIDALAGNVCPGFQQNGCPQPLLLACLPSNPQCQDGTCRDVTELDCDTARTEISSLILEAEAAAPRDCNTDADCTILERSLPCYDACTTDPISLSAAAALQENFDAIGRTRCPSVLAAGCNPIAISCVPLQPIACQQGKCAFAR